MWREGAPRSAAAHPQAEREKVRDSTGPCIASSTRWAHLAEDGHYGTKLAFLYLCITF